MTPINDKKNPQCRGWWRLGGEGGTSTLFGEPREDETDDRVDARFGQSKDQMGLGGGLSLYGGNTVRLTRGKKAWPRLRHFRSALLRLIMGHMGGNGSPSDTFRQRGRGGGELYPLRSTWDLCKEKT